MKKEGEQEQETYRKKRTHELEHEDEVLQDSYRKEEQILRNSIEQLLEEKKLYAHISEHRETFQ